MKFKSVLIAAVTLVAIAAFSIPAYAFDTTPLDMYRLYNPNSGEHFYTSNVDERDDVVAAGWNYEGTGWVAPTSSDAPVYRLYNPNAGDHHYTMNAKERDNLKKEGWRYEGIGWYSDTSQTVKVYREYNPNAIAGAHNFTTSADEDEHLGSVGWNQEGLAWYALDYGKIIQTDTSIMGSTRVSAAGMAAYYRFKGKEYPSDVYASKGAASIDDFAAIVEQEATAEGVRADVVFCQAMWETGWLGFGGDVDPAQCNFAGLGATGGGAQGAWFPDVRTGVRAQVQHLKAYASYEPLNNECVDPRFGLVDRGVAPTLPELNGRWAVPGETYGQDIMRLINEMIDYNS